MLFNFKWGLFYLVGFFCYCFCFACLIFILSYFENEGGVGGDKMEQPAFSVLVFHLKILLAILLCSLVSCPVPLYCQPLHLCTALLIMWMSLFTHAHHVPQLTFAISFRLEVCHRWWRWHIYIIFPLAPTSLPCDMGPGRNKNIVYSHFDHPNP